MYGMPLAQALVFFTSLIVLVLATQWRGFHPFLVIVAIASAFGFIAGFPAAQLGSVFGSGFSEKIYSPGLVIVAAGFVAGLAESTGASDRLTATTEHWRWLGSNWIAGLLGLIAGIGALPAAAFALLTPLLPAANEGTVQARERTTIALALAISAGHGLVLLSPVPIAAAAILDADWGRVALFGLPLALLLAAFGVTFAGWLRPVGAAPESLRSEPLPRSREVPGGSAILLILAIALPLLLLMVQSLGDIRANRSVAGRLESWSLE